MRNLGSFLGSVREPRRFALLKLLYKYINAFQKHIFLTFFIGLCAAKILSGIKTTLILFPLNVLLKMKQIMMVFVFKEEEH